jgi:hypothetical protein
MSGVPTLAEYITYWLREVVEPNLAPGSYKDVRGTVPAQHRAGPGS